MEEGIYLGNISIPIVKGEKGDKGDTGAQGIQGVQGVAGESATITVGDVQTGTPDTQASVVNVGTEQDAIFNFIIPQGITGAKGDKGDAGTTDYNQLTNKPTIPSKTSDLTNDSGFLTDSDLTDYVKNTDYATSSTGGVVRIGNGASIVSNSGILQASTTDSFNSMGNNYFIGYGTLKNYLTHISNEVATNKVTSLSSSSTDTQYPSAKCVYDLVGDIESILETLDTGSGV